MICAAKNKVTKGYTKPFLKRVSIGEKFGSTARSISGQV